MTNSAAPLTEQQEIVSSVAKTMLDIVRVLVEEPLLVAVNPVAGPRDTVLVVTVGPHDLGKVIGKQGRTANSLRAVLHAIGTKRGQRFQLDIRSVEQSLRDPLVNRPSL